MTINPGDAGHVAAHNLINAQMPLKLDTTALDAAAAAVVAVPSSTKTVLDATYIGVNAPLKMDRDNGQAGIIAPSTPLVLSSADAVMTSGRVYVSRFVPSRAMTARALAYRVAVVAANDDPVEVGILSSTGVVLVSSGSVTGRLNSTGLKTITLADTNLTAGQTYYAFWLTVAAGTVASIRRVTVEPDAFGTGLGVCEAGGATGKTIPLASPLTGFGSNGTVPMMVIREFP